MNYEQTIEFLYSLQKFGIKFGLSSTVNLLAGLGDPHKSLRCLHLAGTNGKGSVGATVAEVLSRAGYKVGFYSSPHLVTFRERFAVDGRMVSPEKVVDLAARVRAVMAEQEPPTFFEFVTVMAFLLFAEEKVDLAVMETGMGGRLDATNVINPLAGVITNISLEHQDYLGRTLTDIAGEKAGIIKPGLEVVTGEKRPNIRGLFEKKAQEQGGRLYALGRDFRVRNRPSGGFDYQGLRCACQGLKTRLPGPHQVRNAGLALATLEILAEKGYNYTEGQVREGLASVAWPGRAEIFPGSPPVMLDGAHNPDAARALAALLRGQPYSRVHMVLGIMADKDIGRILKHLLPEAQALYLTRPVYARAADPGVLAEAAAAFTGPKTLYSRLPEAIEAARAAAGPDDLVLVTGSLFTVGEARSYLTGQPMD